MSPAIEVIEKAASTSSSARLVGSPDFAPSRRAVAALDVAAVGDEQLELQRLEIVRGVASGEKPSSTARMAST